MTDKIKTIWWNDENNSIMLIDQTKLPIEVSVIEITTVDRLVEAIHRLAIRGAPALGIAGAFGVALSAISCVSNAEFLETVQADAELLRNIRPTAVNLAWGIDKVLRAIENLPPEMAKYLAIIAAKTIAANDEKCCMLLGHNGASLLPQIGTILTHCNAGALACSSWGTALGVIRSAHKMGKKISVISCETRPLLQGARLTTWELARDNIPVTAIIDSEAAYLMRQGQIDCVVVGADRITQDVVFNKIGTYMHAVCARHHHIPFYVAAPISSFDIDTVETNIMVEQRSRDEVAFFGGQSTIPEGVPVLNYAFDATPLDLVTAIITEKGVFYPPYDFSSLE
ncbi:MAG TPA: S-methyl-5-thioribose-1-phosphate isomerase [Methanocorpusculum sp.]|nr:S-methyl-5-thioribose-1-phosphate isomerase [Methanocorpusculum sp.]HJK02506.1 S-methyl-5-thioribose-1-phosphate isomerase [Methanocorpusculum sp.]